MSSEPALYMWKKTWHYSEGNRKNVILYIILFVIANLIIFIQPLVLASLLDTVQLEGVTPANLHKLLVMASLFIFTIVGFWIFHAPGRIIETKNAFLVRANFKKHMVDGVLDMPPEWHSEHHSGDTIDKIEKGGMGLYRFSGSTFEIIETIVRLFSSIIAMAYFNLGSGLIVIFFVVIAVSIVIRYDKRLRAYYKEINLSENAAAQKIFDIISNITTVIILRIEKLASADIFRRLMAPFGTFDKYTKTNELKWALVSFTSSFMIFSVLAAYLIKVSITGELVLIGTLYALYGYVERISGLFYRFAYKYSDIVQQKSSMENAEMISNDFRKKENTKKTSLGRWKELKVENLTFSYHKQKEELHLEGISMRIRRGEKIALIGESGSGKTTFLKLLRGLYKPKKFELRLGNERIDGFESISDDVTLIPQDPELFTTTIRENITLGLDYTDSEIRKYTSLAEFTHVADRLPKKLESAINEKGVNLSGGEKQRLALSRGLLACKGKQIILLDEPTSSVDSKNELSIYKNIFREFKDKTVISTVHRLHMLDLFDTIYLFERGRIVASGSLSDMRKSEQFRELWKKYTEKRRK